MNELIAIKVELNNHGKPIASIQGTTSYYGISPNDTFYRQEDADRYINLIKDKANYNEYAFELKSEELASTCRFYENELRHQKYKRCLAMAKWCYAKWDDTATKYYKSVWYRKWEVKWLALAEKFKEAK